MTFDFYQKEARSTAIYPDLGNNLYYPTLGLAGEAGEVCEKVKKIMRDEMGIVSDNKREMLKQELGDVLWYAANLAEELGLSFAEIAVANVEKLKSRQKRNVLHGSGDER